MPKIEVSIKNKIVHFVQGDLRKLTSIYNIYNNKPELFSNNIIDNIFKLKSYNDDTRKITKKLINDHYPIEEHLTIMNETDRTIVGLLWHENVIDVISKINLTIIFLLWLTN